MTSKTLIAISVMQRLAWAGKHIDAAHNLSNSCVNSDFYTLSAKQESKGRLVVRADKVAPYPREFSLLIGDAAHNIRAALDNLAFAIVKPTPGHEKNVYFPIAKTKKAFRNLAASQLPGVSVRVRAAFERLQPYHRRKMPEAKCLAMLHALNNWDKHRTLAVCSVVTGGINFRPTIMGAHSIISIRVKNGILKENAILATFQMSDTTGESEVQMNPEIIVAPVFDIRMPKELAGIPVIEVLRRTLWYVERTIVPDLRKFL